MLYQSSQIMESSAKLSFKESVQQCWLLRPRVFNPIFPKIGNAARTF
ncbi:MAG: hypothetical protein ACI9XR_001628 [Flavobacterium sp.]|jgi:hypothetical protein